MRVVTRRRRTAARAVPWMLVSLLVAGALAPRVDARGTIAAAARRAPSLGSPPPKDCGPLDGPRWCVIDVWEGEFVFTLDRRVLRVGDVLAARVHDPTTKYDHAWVWNMNEGSGPHGRPERLAACPKATVPWGAGFAYRGAGACRWRMRDTTSGWVAGAATLLIWAERHDDQAPYAVIARDRSRVGGTATRAGGAPAANLRIELVGGRPARRWYARSGPDGVWDAVVPRGTYAVRTPAGFRPARSRVVLSRADTRLDVRAG